MQAELTVLGLAALLQIALVGLSGMALTRDAGPEWNMGPRDQPAPLSPLAGRLKRASDNGFEGLILFTIAVIIAVAGEATSGFTAFFAWAFLFARVLYIPAYAYGWAPWRSMIWAVGLLATCGMILAAFMF